MRYPKHCRSCGSDRIENSGYPLFEPICRKCALIQTVNPTSKVEHRPAMTAEQIEKASRDVRIFCD